MVIFVEKTFLEGRCLLSINWCKEKYILIFWIVRHTLCCLLVVQHVGFLFHYLLWRKYITVRSHEHHGISNCQQLNSLFNSLLRWLERKYQSSTLLSLCELKPSITNGFPSQKASYADSISVSWHRYARISQQDNIHGTQIYCAGSKPFPFPRLYGRDIHHRFI